MTRDLLMAKTPAGLVVRRNNTVNNYLSRNVYVTVHRNNVIVHTVQNDDVPMTRAT